MTRRCAITSNLLKCNLRSSAALASSSFLALAAAASHGTGNTTFDLCGLYPLHPFCFGEGSPTGPSRAPQALRGQGQRSALHCTAPFGEPSLP
mmetsp:Transcript_38430/g.121461  ORF Transcript_38430/g.121461 Transcript_38430/m.121461 type:complete len:93 (+) Transcript_38430:982-1260(+)